MSSTFSKNNKELAGLKVISSKEAYVYNPKTKKNDLPNPNLDFFGKVDTKFSNFVLKVNKEDKKTGYIEDVSSAPRRLKIDLVNHFYDKNGKRNSKTVAYLIRTDKKAKKKK